MRHLLLSCVLFLQLPTQAQITIGQEDMPSAGDTMRYFTGPITGFDVSATGPAQVWDHSNLQPQLPGADTAVAVSSTPFLYQFFFNNNILYPEHAANFAMKGVGFAFQGVTLEDVYDYYKKGPTGYRNVGFGATVNGLPASVRRIPVDWIHRFPLEYGDQDTSFSAFEIDIPTLGFFGQTQWRYNHVDGWGTLILPSATFEVLRVRSVLVRRDTLFVDQFGFGFGFNEPQTVEHKWIAPGMDAPVLQVTTVAGVVTAVRFFHDPMMAVGQVQVGTDMPYLYPNPGYDLAYLLIPQGQGGLLQVSDAMGRVVMAPRTTTTSLERIALDALPPGTYVVQLNSATAFWSTRLIVQ